MELIFLPMLIFLAVPYLAFVPAALFAACYWRARGFEGGRFSRALLILTAAVWVAYGIYEIRMFYWSRTVIAPIRVDLFLAAPIIYLVTILGALACWRLARQKRKE